MSLLDSAYEPFRFIEKHFSSDGEGGGDMTWVDGAIFNATADFPSSSLANIANALTEKVSVTITTSRAIVLEPMDVIQRISDGQYFRVTSDGKNKKTPVSASLDMRQVSAELWRLPDN